MKRLLSFLVVAFCFSIAAHAEFLWAGVWYHTKSPVPSDRLQGLLEVRLATNGTVQANFIRKLGLGFHSTPSESGTWTLKKPGVYHITFVIGAPVSGYRFTGTIRKNLMTGKFETTGRRRDESGSHYYAGKFQCTLYDDEDDED
ncbi:MAG TPA: hypothetical protein VK846_10265 [Candidatus Limnocylindria bacterium]|nr:hypothetical protein [Candidatus Limnocylindria bacterium]